MKLFLASQRKSVLSLHGSDDYRIPVLILKLLPPMEVKKKDEKER